MNSSALSRWRRGHTATAEKCSIFMQRGNQNETVSSGNHGVLGYCTDSLVEADCGLFMQKSLKINHRLIYKLKGFQDINKIVYFLIQDCEMLIRESSFGKGTIDVFRVISQSY